MNLLKLIRLDELSSIIFETIKNTNSLNIALGSFKTEVLQNLDFF